MSVARFVLNIKSNKLHFKDCYHIRKLPKQQIKSYYTIDEAEAESEHKLTYCKTCKPDLKSKEDD